MERGQGPLLEAVGGRGLEDHPPASLMQGRHPRGLLQDGRYSEVTLTPRQIPRRQPLQVLGSRVGPVGQQHLHHGEITLHGSPV